MDVEDIDTAVLVRPIEQDLSVEAPGAQRRRIEDLGPVGGREGHARLASNCAGEQGLASARRPQQKDALGHAARRVGRSARGP